MSEPHEQSAPTESGRQPFAPPQQYAHVSTFGPPQRYGGVPPFGAPQPSFHVRPFGRQGAEPSGFLVAAGIAGIVFGMLLLLPAIDGLGPGGGGFMAFPILLAALANIASGIVLLAHRRARARWVPVASISTAGFPVILGLLGPTSDYYGVTLLLISLLLAVPILILLGIGIARDRRSVWCIANHQDVGGR